jgi:nicotinate phosphoribosyltransferase
MAHSYIMSFENELDAFRSFVKTFPHGTTLLIDTYDTIQGAKNAAVVAKELEISGYRLGAVRLDSGNLYELSLAVRKILNEAGLQYVNITASSDLNEYKIRELKKANVITAYGVGTEMSTAKPVSAIPGVYKLVDDKLLGARIKLSAGKKTLPSKKQIYREYGPDGKILKDIISLESEWVKGTNLEKLLYLTIKDGKRVRRSPSVSEIREYCLSQIFSLPNNLKEVEVKQQYLIEYSIGLQSLIKELTDKYK